MADAVKVFLAFIGGFLLGSVLLILKPEWRPPSEVRAAEDTARAARARSTSDSALAAAAVDSLNAWRPLVEEALARPRVVRPGPTPGTVVIEAPADTPRVVVVPPEVVAQIRDDSVRIFRLTVERGKAQAAVARLEAAARADDLADKAAGFAAALARADLEDQLADARRSARWWKIGGVVLVGLIAVDQVGGLLK